MVKVKYDFANELPCLSPTFSIRLWAQLLVTEYPNRYFVSRQVLALRDTLSTQVLLFEFPSRYSGC